MATLRTASDAMRLLASRSDAAPQDAGRRRLLGQAGLGLAALLAGGALARPTWAQAPGVAPAASAIGPDAAGLGQAAWADGLVQGFGRLPDPAAVQRVFAAGPPAAVLVYCLARAKLLGWPFRPSQQALAWLAPEQRNLPHLGRLAGRGSTVPLETLVSLKPDLIVDAGTVSDTERSGMQAVVDRTGIAGVLVDGTLRSAPEQLRQVGVLLGVAERGARLGELAAGMLAQAAASAPASPPSVYLARASDGLETAMAGAIHAEAIVLAGGRNAADPLGRGGLARVSLEQVMAWNPDIILAQDRAFVEMAQQSPLWRSLRAVRNGQLRLMPSLPFGWVDGPPGINRLGGLPWLSALFAAQAADTALAGRIHDFMRAFYDTPASVEDVAALLAA